MRSRQNFMTCKRKISRIIFILKYDKNCDKWDRIYTRKNLKQNLEKHCERSKAEIYICSHENNLKKISDVQCICSHWGELFFSKRKFMMHN